MEGWNLPEDGNREFCFQDTPGSNRVRARSILAQACCCLGVGCIDTWVFPKMRIPQNGWFTMVNPIKMDDLGVPLFSETPTCWFLFGNFCCTCRYVSLLSKESSIAMWSQEAWPRKMIAQVILWMAEIRLLTTWNVKNPVINTVG